MEEIKDPRQEGIGGLQGLNRSKKYPTLEIGRASCRERG